MNIKIKGVDLEITEAIRDYAEKKIKESLEKFNTKEELLAEIEIGKTNKHHNSGEIYEVKIKLSGMKKEIFVEEKKDDLYAAIDGVKDKLEYKFYSVRGKNKTLTHKIALKFKNIFKKGE